MDQHLLEAIKKAKESNQEGFQIIYEKTIEYVHFRATNTVKEDDVWDLIQEVYIAAFKSISSLQNEEHIYAWLGGITYNLGMKIHRKNKKNPVLLQEEHEDMLEEAKAEDRFVQPELSMEDRERSFIIKDLINQLPELQKAAVIAYYFDNRSVGEIAEYFECSEGTIKSRLNYARKFLKNAVEQMERREGYCIRGITIPTILYAIHLLQENCIVPEAKAAEAYSMIGKSLGLESAWTSVLAEATSEATKETVKHGFKNIVTDLLGLTKVKVAVGVLSAGIISGAAFVAVNHNSAEKNTQPVQNQEVGIEKNLEAKEGSEGTVDDKIMVEIQEELDKIMAKQDLQNTLTSYEESELFAISGILADFFILNNYKKGDRLSDEEKMALVYRFLYHSCIENYNPNKYEHLKKVELPEVASDGSPYVSDVYIIPQEDIQLLLQTVFGEGISENKTYDGLVYRNGKYYLYLERKDIGVSDYKIGTKEVFNPYDRYRNFHLKETVIEDYYQVVGTREVGYYDTESGDREIKITEYTVKFRLTDSTITDLTKFGRFQLDSYEGGTCSEEETVELYLKKDNFYGATRLRQGELYMGTDYIDYNWNEDNKHILILLNNYNGVGSEVLIYEYNDAKHSLVTSDIYTDFFMEDTIFYKENNGIICICDYFEGDDYIGTFCDYIEWKDSGWTVKSIYYHGRAGNEIDGKGCSDKEMEEKMNEMEAKCKTLDQVHWTPAMSDFYRERFD